MRHITYRLLVSILGLGVSITAQAAPWTPANDAQLRASIEWLADRGCLAAPVTSWPMAWADVQLASIDEHCVLSSAWLYAQGQKDKLTHTTLIKMRLEGANEATLFRHFAQQPREKGQLSAGVEFNQTHFSVGFNAAFVPEPYGLDKHQAKNQWRADGSYVAGMLGNWALGVGALDRWWGPGQSNSLIVSHNARPVPAVFLQRQESSAFDVPVLRWLGPWHFSAFFGQLEAGRHIPHAKFMGFRASIKPFSWLELGATRALQWGGEGRPQSLNSWWDALLGRDNIHGDTTNEPGNQLAGFDFRLSQPLGKTSTFQFYGQLAGEDEAGYLPSKNAFLFGSGLSGQWWQGRQQIWVEYTNTLADDLDGRPKPNVLYQHHLYKSGYRYYGRSLGSTWDGDSETTTLGISQFFPSQKELLLQTTFAHLNKADRLSGAASYYPVPVLAAENSNKMMIYRLQYRQPFLQGRLGLSAEWFDHKVKRLDNTSERLTLTASWEYHFVL